MAARVELREISNEEGNRLLRFVRRGSGSVVTWRRAQIVLLAAQRIPAARIAEVVFSDPDTVREVIHNFNHDGFDSLYPRYRGGRPRTFTLPERQQIKKIALAIPSDLGQPFGRIESPERALGDQPRLPDDRRRVLRSREASMRKAGSSASRSRNSGFDGYRRSRLVRRAMASAVLCSYHKYTRWSW